MQIFEFVIDWIYTNWVTIVLILHVCISLVTALHVLMFKENERTSLAWIGLIIFSPMIGSLFYWLFGINRIKRAARKKHPKTLRKEFLKEANPIAFHNIPKNWHPAIISGYKIHQVEYVKDNKIVPLINGEKAYPAMIDSINSAKRYVVLTSYIFDNDSLGLKFVEALANAHKRGVEVKVLLDGIGIGYGWRKSDNELHDLGVKTARFLPTSSFANIRFINLRNHRKILCVDGEEAYVGGMNVSKHNLVRSSKHPIDDVHFKVVGPVIDQISQVFIEDWYFATRELIKFPRYTARELDESDMGTVIARVIQDGPDEDHNKIRWTLFNALVCAQTSVKIITPYFIPGDTLMTSLHAAVMRGVSIEIIIPEHSDIFFLDWVMEANFSRIIEHGIKLYKNKRPFDHSKIMVIDNDWSFIGSANWDARSLEFNFEINVECFDENLNAELNELFSVKKRNSIAVIQKDIDSLSLLKRMRNNVVRLFSPYL